MNASLQLTTQAFSKEMLSIELSRFFQVAKAEAEAGRSDCFMPDCPVDEYWHELLESPEEYHAFCMNAVGVHVEHINDHERYPQYQGYGTLTWVPTYEKLFGKLPAVWFANSAGSINWEEYAPYSKQPDESLGLNPKASWKCNPYAVWENCPKASWKCNPKLPLGQNA